MMRTSQRSGRVPPTRWNSPSCSTRSSFTWVAGVMSPISSRNSVPPSACSKRPARWRSAPVNAPRSWPNSSDSSSVSGSAAQFTFTKGRAARGEPPWISPATSSLPVPVSPVRSTVERLGATRCASSTAACIAALSPTISVREAPRALLAQRLDLARPGARARPRARRAARGTRARRASAGSRRRRASSPRRRSRSSRRPSSAPPRCGRRGRAPRAAPGRRRRRAGAGR